MEESRISLDQSRRKCPSLGFVDDNEMTNWVQTVFVRPGVKGGEIEVNDLFPVYYHMIELHGVGASTAERFSRLEPGNEFEGIDKLTHGVVLLLESFALSFDYFWNRAVSEQKNLHY